MVLDDDNDSCSVSQESHITHHVDTISYQGSDPLPRVVQSLIFLCAICLLVGVTYVYCDIDSSLRWSQEELEPETVAQSVIDAIRVATHIYRVDQSALSPEEFTRTLEIMDQMLNYRLARAELMMSIIQT